jgi:hypothetical protein
MDDDEFEQHLNKILVLSPISREKLEKNLISFADSLIPSDKYIDYGTKLGEKVNF